MSAPHPGPGDPELRIGDAEREAAVGALGEHYAAGRLSKEEFDERADAAWAARTRSALWPLFTDLPNPVAAPAGTAPAPPRARQGGGPHAGRPHPGWRVGGRMVPLLMVVFAIVVLTHLPVFLLLLVWVFWARTHGAWGHGRPGMHDRR
jgi:uncharacterized membrane protein